MAREILLECAQTLTAHGWSPRPDFFDEDLSTFTVTKAEALPGEPKEQGFLAARPDRFISLQNQIREQRKALMTAQENTRKRKRSEGELSTKYTFFIFYILMY